MWRGIASPRDPRAPELERDQAHPRRPSSVSIDAPRGRYGRSRSSSAANVTAATLSHSAVRNGRSRMRGSCLTRLEREDHADAVDVLAATAGIADDRKRPGAVALGDIEVTEALARRVAAVLVDGVRTAAPAQPDPNVSPALTGNRRRALTSPTACSRRRPDNVEPLAVARLLSPPPPDPQVHRRAPVERQLQVGERAGLLERQLRRPSLAWRPLTGRVRARWGTLEPPRPTGPRVDPKVSSPPHGQPPGR